MSNMCAHLAEFQAHVRILINVCGRRQEAGKREEAGEGGKDGGWKGKSFLLPHVNN